MRKISKNFRGFSVRGLDDTIREMNKFVIAVDVDIGKVALDAAKKVIDLAKAGVMATPSAAGGRTGARREIARNIDVKKQRMRQHPAVRARVAVWYKNNGRERVAHLLEYGFRLTHYFGTPIRSRKIPDKPFMRPAFNKVNAMYGGMVSMELRKAR